MDRSRCRWKRVQFSALLRPPDALPLHSTSFRFSVQGTCVFPIVNRSSSCQHKAAGSRMSLFLGSFEPLNMGSNSVEVEIDIGSTKLPCRFRRCACMHGSFADVQFPTYPKYEPSGQVFGNWGGTREVGVNRYMSSKRVGRASTAHSVPIWLISRPCNFFIQDLLFIIDGGVGLKER